MPKKSLLDKFVPFLLVLTIGLAFAVGVLWQKVTTMEKGAKVASLQGAVATPSDNVANTGKLTADQAKKLAKVTNTDHIRGKIDAKVVLVEYSDLECPFCKQFDTTMKQAIDFYGDKLAWVYRHYPLDTLHSKARNEALNAECAYDQQGDSGFWTYTDKVYEITPSNNGLDPAKLPQIASQMGLDMVKFSACVASGKYKDKIENELQGGLTAGVQGTPGNFVVNQKGDVWFIPGAYPLDQLKQVIDEALKG